MAKTITQRIGDFNTKVADILIPDTGMKEKVERLDGVNDSRTRKYVLKSVYPDTKTRDEVMEYLCGSRK